jgi:hypothetical protein
VLAIALLTTSGATMSQLTPQPPAVRDAAAPAADAPIQVGVRIGHTVLPPTATFKALRAAIEQSNSRFRLAGLVDELNPDIIDVDKALALMAFVPTFAKKAPKRFASRLLYLSNGGLRIGSADASMAAGFFGPFKLEVEEVKGELLLARSTVPVVPQLARERSTQAQSQLAAENARIDQLEVAMQAAPEASEQRRAMLNERTQALWRRSALVRSWSANAELLNRQLGAGAAAKAEVEAAEKAVKKYLLVGAGGMPGSR